MDYLNRKYIIFDVSEIDKIDFNQVIETSSYTLGLSFDETKTFVKWIGDTPSCIDSLTTKSQVYDYNEFVNILNGPEWTVTSGTTIN